MELTVYDIIKGVHLTPKSMILRHKQGKFTFKINSRANKVMVRNAVEKIWKVKVENVRILALRSKKKAFGRRHFLAPDTKKAIITLKKGYKIDLPDQYETMGIAPEAARGA